MSLPMPAPVDIRDFAKALGWQLLPEAVADGLYVLNNPDLPTRQIVLPMDDSAPDYAEAAHNALAKLAEIRQQPFTQIVNSVQTVHEDALRYKIISGRDSGDLPLSFATSLLRGVQQMLLSAACTVLKPQLYHPSLRLSEARKFIENARFGQTERGSYILKVSCPVTSRDPLPQSHDSTPFVRQTTLALKSAVRSLIDAIESDTLDAFITNVKSSPKPLLSSNLCDAIAMLHDEGVKNSVELLFSWGYGIPLPQTGQGSDTIRIQHAYFSTIEEVASQLRATEAIRVDTFVGTVERLNGEMRDDGRREGEVLLAVLLREGESVRVKVNLSPDNYKAADQAHMTYGAFVKVTGKLHPGRQPRQLTDVSNFSLIKP